MILLNERLKGIIRILKDTQDYITSKQLADQMDISVRTIKSTLKGLKMELTAYGAELEIKRGVGYRLHILNEEAFLPIKNRLSRVNRLGSFRIRKKNVPYISSESFYL